MPISMFSSNRKQLMKDIQPYLDFLVIQMDGDVSRKEKSAHCWCPTTQCEHKGFKNPLECDITPQGREACPVILPCKDHMDSIDGYTDHLKSLITQILQDTEDTCITIPCDSTEAWIVAAYDEIPEIEYVVDPWTKIIAHGKSYHNIRVPGKKKHVRIFEKFAPVVCENWNKVTRLCKSARDFEDSLRLLTKTI